NGSYSVQFSAPLADGSYPVRVRASDAAGNSSVSSVLTIFIDATPPLVLSFNPSGTQTTPVTQLSVTFNDDDLNNTASGNVAFSGFAQNPANYSLVASGGDGIFGNGNDVVFNLSTSQFLYDAASDSLVIHLRDSSGNNVALPNDTWRFTIKGTGTPSLQDLAGNSIAGGDFVSTFTVAVAPFAVSDIRLLGTSR